MKKILLFASAVAVLFSSCSTDSTSDVIGNEAKNGTITATAAYQQDATRTYLDDEAGDVFWSKGDAIGVLNETGTHVQFGLVSGEGTATGQFEGNKNFLAKGAPVYAYYPFTKGTTFAEETKAIELEIMSEQTFLDVATFDAAQAPGVAYVESVEDLDNIALNFKGVASYVKFPIKGIGTLKSLTLSMNGQTLAGVGTVDFAKWPTAKEIAAVKDGEDAYAALALDIAQGDDEITVNLGALELHPYNTQEILFVIPAGTTVSGEISLVAEFADGSTQQLTKDALNSEVKITRNEVRRIWANNKAAWTFGLKGKYVIDSDAKATSAYGDGLTAEERFLAYAYLTRPGQEDTKDYTDYYYAADALDIDAENIATVEALVFEETLDFADYTANWAQTQYDATSVVLGNNANDKAAAFWKNVYAWFKGNKGAIESLAYNAVVGAPYEGAAQATIKNLKVVGAGISAGASLKNLVFEAIEVATDADIPAAGLIAPYSYMTNQPHGAAPADMVIENVVISADNSVNAPKAQFVGGIYGSYNKNVNMIGGARAINIVAPGTRNTGLLFGVSLVGTFLDFTANNYQWDANAAAKYYAVGWLKTDATLVAEGVVDATKKNAGVAGLVSNSGNEIASVIVDGVSYWNGGAEDINPNNDYYTAENLAYDLSQGKGDIILANNIDMQCVFDNFMNVTPLATEEAAPAAPATEAQYIELNHAVTSKYTVTSKEDNQFEIKNIVAFSNTLHVALFGRQANLSNVTLSNITLYADKTEGNGLSTLAGIAYKGSADNVAINGLTINIVPDAKIATDVIGGVFAIATNNEIKNVTVSALTINYAGEKALNARAGIIAGTLEVAPTTTPVVLEGIKLTGAKADYAVNNIGELYKQSGKIAAFETAKNYAGAYPFGTIYVNNAYFPANSKGKAYVGVDEAFETWGNAGAGQGNRLAAGVVFNSDLTSAAEGTVTVGADGNEYDYAFELTGGVRVGNVDKTNFFGFTAK